MADEIKGRPSALCVVGSRQTTYLLLDRPISFFDVADAVNDHLRNPDSAIFGDAKRIGAERYKQLVMGHVEALGEMAGIYRVDLVGETVSELDGDCGWRVFGLDDICMAARFAGSTEFVPYTERRRNFDRTLQNVPSSTAPVTLYASRPINERDFIPDDSIEAIDDLLNFYLAINCDVDELFGTHFDQHDSDSLLNVYADYNMDTGRVEDYLDLTLCRYDGVDIPMRYRLSDSEKDMILAKMGDYCKMRGSTLSEWREWYLGNQEAEAGPSAVTKQTM